MTIAIILTTLGILTIVGASWRVFIKRNLDGANLDRATAELLDGLPFLNRQRRRACLRAMRRRNGWERMRQGFGPRGSWFALTHRSRYTVKLATPDTDP